MTLWTVRRRAAHRGPSVLLALVPFVAIVGTAALDGASPEETGRSLQVLGDRPADELRPTMELFAASLGVACSHCHVRGDFASDAKEAKRIAREMVRMTRSLDREVFQGRQAVSCFTCHRGSTKPVDSPLLALPGGGFGDNVERAPWVPDGPLVLAGVLDRHVAALGGDAWRRVASWSGRGRALLDEGRFADVRLESSSQLAASLEIDLPNGTRRESWSAAASEIVERGHPRPMTPGERALSVLFDPFVWTAEAGPFQLEEGEPRGRERVGSRETVVVGGRLEGTEVEMSFDLESGLLRRIRAWTTTAVGKLPVSIDGLEYRERDGLQVPERWIIRSARGAYAVELAAVEFGAADPSVGR